MTGVRASAHDVAGAPTRVCNHTTGAPAPSSRYGRELLREVVPRIASAIAGVTRLPADGEAGFLATLRREQERGTRADERANQESRSDEADVFPVDGSSVRFPARPCDDGLRLRRTGEPTAECAGGVRPWRSRRG